MRRPTSPCNDWFGETMLRHAKRETAAVGADARIAESARSRSWPPRDHAAAASPRETVASCSRSKANPRSYALGTIFPFGVTASASA